jgi:hypothetical protein
MPNLVSGSVLSDEMEGKSAIQPSAAGLRNATSPIYKDTFQFIVGDRSYLCKPFIADFLSPRIGRIYLRLCFRLVKAIGFRSLRQRQFS